MLKNMRNKFISERWIKCSISINITFVKHIGNASSCNVATIKIYSVMCICTEYLFALCTWHLINIIERIRPIFKQVMINIFASI